MKQIPFKCKFGHVTIKNFSNKEERPSIVVCEKCIEINKLERVLDERVWFAGTKHTSKITYTLEYFRPRKGYNKNTEIVEAIRF